MERFLTYVEKTDGCWNWTGWKDEEGYGRFTAQRNGKYVSWRSHRWMYSQTYELDALMVVRHSCDNPSCVNPEHLSVGTHADNMRDKMERGRWSGGRPKGSKSKEKYSRTHVPEQCSRCGKNVFPVWKSRHVLVCPPVLV